MKTTRKHPAATRHFGTRTLCLLMSLVMALSLVQVSVFATEAPAQVMSGNYVLNKDGTISEDGSGNAVTAATARTQGDYTLTKTAAANSSRGENWFNVTVQVGTTQTITTNDAAVVLVIDTSGSMAYCAECGGEKSHSSTCKYYNKNKHNNDVTLEQSRMAATITEAKAFVQNLKDSNSGGKVYVSVVRFSGFSQSDASLVRNWTDVSTDAGAAAVKNSINSTNLFARGGTNMEAGLMMARNLLNVTAASIGGGSVNISALANKYTVLLTDGQPTARCNTDHTGLGAISDYNEDGDGSATSTAEYEETVSM
ncbi:MAG TPA: vWA domain-containing protein, partial [Oscillospiraceae bacterium]|nr:vWA domain-containing protein [Oscillospiraceae bacterium]